MDSTNSVPVETSLPTEDLVAKALSKRYEGLVTVRGKAIKGKGAWYWVHLEPILIRNPSTSLPKAVKLKCSLCDAVFSASNPSRTASEHLKKGACPNFSFACRPNSSVSPLPISSIPSSPFQSQRKRSSEIVATHPSPPPFQVHSLAMIESSRFCGELVYSASAANPVSTVNNMGMTQQTVLSGGKEDFSALAMLESSVKKLKSPKASPGPRLSKEQIDSALELLADWLFESCGAVSFSSVDHPKFGALLNHLGLPALPRRELLGARLDAKFHEAKAESEARIRDAMFFQIASSGWKSKNCCRVTCGEEDVVRFMVNLPNGTTVFQKAFFTGGSVSSKYAEEVLSETVIDICGSAVERCIGVVADKYKAKALKNLETQNHWMVNLSCLLQGFCSMVKDFNRELPLFRAVSQSCLKVANFINTNLQVRNIFQRYKLQELEFVGLLRVPSPNCDASKNFLPFYTMLEDILGCSRVLQMVVLDESYKLVCVDDPVAREVSIMIQSEGFWNEVEAVYSLVKIIRGMAQDIETERPLIGQCLPLWEDLRAKVKEWCAKFSIPEGTVEKIIEKRFRKSYHPAWSAAYILDPLYLKRDSSGKYLPPFKCLTQEQEKDVDKLITRLVCREEAHVALAELMKWRSEGLDPLYAQAVQIRQRDPLTGKSKIANPRSSGLVWDTCLSDFKSLRKVAVRLIFLHATSCGYKCNWSVMKLVSVHGQSRVGLERAQKMIFIAAHAKLERRDFSDEEEKDAELFGLGEDDMVNGGSAAPTV